MKRIDELSRVAPSAGRGMTLVELLIVITIIAILAAVGYPSYTQYIVRSNRAVAKSVLLQVADRQEQFFANRKTYAANLTDLGYTANNVGIDDQGAQTALAATDTIYGLSLTNVTPTTFTVNAAPMHTQAARDTKCRTMMLTHAGEKGQTGAGTDCW